MINTLKFVCLALFAASSAIAKPPGVPPGPPAVEIEGVVDTNVVNTVDANVINTVDTNVSNTVDTNVLNTVDTNVLNTVNTNVVNTIASDALVGVDALILNGPGGRIITAPGVTQLRAISTSIASNVAGEICNVSVVLRLGDGDDRELGLSVMSNGQAQTVSRNYETPIAPAGTLIWEIEGNATGGCWVSLSVVAETLDEPDAARLSGSAQPMQIEVR